MLRVLTLKCENCNANLEISPEMEKFSCGYCAAAQIVQRSGGTVSLKLVTDAIKQVQVGTDKTAAELAIRRMKDDLQQIDIQHIQLHSVMNTELSKNSNRYLIAGVFATVFGLCKITSDFALLFAIVWVVIIVVI